MCNIGKLISDHWGKSMFILTISTGIILFILFYHSALPQIIYDPNNLTDFRSENNISNDAIKTLYIRNLGETDKIQLNIIGTENGIQGGDEYTTKIINLSIEVKNNTSKISKTLNNISSKLSSNNSERQSIILYQVQQNLSEMNNSTIRLKNAVNNINNTRMEIIWNETELSKEIKNIRKEIDNISNMYFVTINTFSKMGEINFKIAFNPPSVNKSGSKSALNRDSSKNSGTTKKANLGDKEKPKNVNLGGTVQSASVAKPYPANGSSEAVSLSPPTGMISADIMPKFAISGIIFNDANSNGINDTNETGLENWTIKLEQDGKVVDKTKTGVDGKFEFRVSASAMGDSTAISFSPSNKVIGEEIEPKFAIIGIIFNDANSNGINDTNETGLENWTIELEQAGKVVTGVDGKFEFPNLSNAKFKSDIDFDEVNKSYRIMKNDIEDLNNSANNFIDILEQRNILVYLEPDNERKFQNSDEVFVQVKINTSRVRLPGHYRGAISVEGVREANCLNPGRKNRYQIPISVYINSSQINVSK